MFRNMMSSKIHRATVTESCLDYVGSITIDASLMSAVDIIEDEKVQVVNINTGARFETYAISGKTGSGVICLNGAAARLVQVNDKVIIIAYRLVSENEIPGYRPNVILVDDKNQIVSYFLDELEATKIP